MNTLNESALSEPLRAFIGKMPEVWQIAPFRDLLTEPVRNGVYKSKEYHGHGIRMVNMGELFGNDIISAQDMKRVELMPDEEKKSCLEDGDLLFARRSLVLEGSGKCALVKNLGEKTTFESSIIRARPNKKWAEPRFLFYLFKSPLGRAIVSSIATRTAVSGIRGSELMQLALPIPPLPIQRRITESIAAYDDLIENNTRRIQILEQMAQALYREWFVHFRFPGHAKVKLVESPLGKVPSNWSVTHFGELFAINYGKMLATTQISESGPHPVYGAGSVIGYYDRCLVHEKVALVTCRGNGSGTVWRTREPAFVTNNSLIIRPKQEHGFWKYFFVELLLKHSNVMGVKSGSAQPQITIEGLTSVQAIVPDEAIVRAFCEIGEPVSAMIDFLFQKNTNLRRTRDLLLPKLMSGALDVSALKH